MTEEEILAMKTGEELDKLVAVEVMEELLPEFTPQHALDLQLAGSPVKSPQGNWLCLCTYDEGDIPTWRPVPFSTDISAAWPVVEKVTEQKHCQCKINVYPNGLASVKFTKATGPFTPDEILGWAGFDNDMTAPAAICKAALLTKLDEIKNLEA